LESIYGIISNDSYEYEERNKLKRLIKWSRLHLMGKGEEKKRGRIEDLRLR
jgi:hypothetical protein